MGHEHSPTTTQATIEINETTRASILRVSNAILEKNSTGGFTNQNGFTAFLWEEINKYFPNTTLAEDVLSSMSWGDDDSLCIMNYCNFANPSRENKEESYFFTDWNAPRFEEAILQFIRK